MYSANDSPWGMCVCLAFGSFGSSTVGVGLRECARVSLPQPDGGRSPAFWAGAPLILSDRPEGCQAQNKRLRKERLGDREGEQAYRNAGGEEAREGRGRKGSETGDHCEAWIAVGRGVAAYL
eukprot:567070-Rhodomonas_salina.1